MREGINHTPSSIPSWLRCTLLARSGCVLHQHEKLLFLLLHFFCLPPNWDAKNAAHERPVWADSNVTALVAETICLFGYKVVKLMVCVSVISDKRNQVSLTCLATFIWKLGVRAFIAHACGSRTISGNLRKKKKNISNTRSRNQPISRFFSAVCTLLGIIWKWNQQRAKIRKIASRTAHSWFSGKTA